MISVKFTREQDQLLLSAVYVEGDRLTFVDDVAYKLLEPGGVCDIHWRIVGETGGSLVVVKSVGNHDREIVNSTIAAEDHGRVSDFFLFEV